MHVWINRQRNGEYMITGLRPMLKRVGGAHYEDFYIRPGDPMAMRTSMCESGYKLLTGGAEHLPVLTSRRVRLTVEFVGE